jgi:hypothetical protein
VIDEPASSGIAEVGVGSKASTAGSSSSLKGVQKRVPLKSSRVTETAPKKETTEKKPVEK